MSPIPILFEIAWKSLLVAGATLVVLRLAKDRTAGERSWIAHAGLAVLLALPAAAVLLPAWSPEPATIDTTGTAAAPLLVAADATRAAAPLVQLSPLPASSGSVPPAALALPSPDTVALWLYLVPLALLAATMLVAVLRLATLRGRAQIMEDAPWLTALARAQRRMGFKSGTALLVSDELRSPISWGLVRPIILLNPKALEASGEAEAIIAHELAHVARLDWAKLLISRSACALLWFNPLVWMLAREAHQLREEAADDAVLMSQVDGADYAALLVNAARHDNQGLLIAAHGVAPGKDSLKRRITRVLDASLPRRPASAVWTAAGLVVLTGLAAPLAAFDPFTACTWSEAKAKVAALPVVPEAAAQAVALVAAAVPAGVLPPAEPAAAHHAGKPLSAEDLIQMRAVGVTGRDIAALRAAGVPALSVDEATTAKAVGITPEFAAAMRRAFPNASFDDIVSARAVGIDPAEAGAMRRAWPSATLDDLTAAQATGVTASYVAEMRKVFPDLDIDDLTAMRATGVDPAFVREMQRAFHGGLTPDQAIEARAAGSVHIPQVRADLREAAAVVRASARASAKAVRSVRAPEPVDPPDPPDSDD